MKRAPLVLRGAIRLKCFIQLPWRTHWLEALFTTMQFISMPWVGCWVRETNLVSNQQGRCKQQEFYLGTNSQKLNCNCGSQKVREKWWLTSNLLTTTLKCIKMLRANMLEIPSRRHGKHQTAIQVSGSCSRAKGNKSLLPAAGLADLHRFQLVNSRDVLKACGNQAFNGEKSEQIKKSYAVTA